MITKYRRYDQQSTHHAELIKKFKKQEFPKDTINIYEISHIHSYDSNQLSIQPTTRKQTYPIHHRPQCIIKSWKIQTNWTRNNAPSTLIINGKRARTISAILITHYLITTTNKPWSFGGFAGPVCGKKKKQRRKQRQCANCKRTVADCVVDIFIQRSITHYEKCCEKEAHRGLCESVFIVRFTIIGSKCWTIMARYNKQDRPIEMCGCLKFGNFFRLGIRILYCLCYFWNVRGF